MSVQQEVEHRIREGWQDSKVANWVIKNLPLLEHGYTHRQCPVYKLDLERGLTQLNNEFHEIAQFKEKPKIVISGGFEGTRGHMAALDEVYEHRTLTADSNTPVVIMLEQDSYILKHKQRQPLVNLKERTELWSTSGLVDTVIVLPEQPNNGQLTDFYRQIHGHIAPANWCVNVENKRWHEIILRGEVEWIIDAGRLLSNESFVHTSFLAATSSLRGNQVAENLKKYILDLVKTYENPGQYTFEQIADIVFKKVSEGL